MTPPRIVLLALLAMTTGATGAACTAPGDGEDDVATDGGRADARARDGGPRSDATLPPADGGPSPLWCGLQFVEHKIPAGHACTGATLELGHGADSLAPLSNGDSVPMSMGPQGGLMLFVSFRASGLDPDAVTLCVRTTFTSGGAEVGFDCWQGSLADLSAAGQTECIGLIAQTTPMYWGRNEEVLDHDVTLDFSLTDSTGCQLRAARAVHIAPELAGCSTCP